MYCLKINVIGCDEIVLPHVRREILNNWGTVEREFPTVASAVQDLWLADDEMCLFVIHLQSGDELADLKRLAGTYVGRPIVALIETNSDHALVLKAMRAGAVQVVPLPLHSQDFRDALESVALQFGVTPSRSRVIAVAGAAGGCGSTSVALSLAYELAFLRKEPCLALELSFRMGALASHLDLKPRYTTMDLLSSEERLDSYVVRQALTEFADNFLVLPGPYEAIQLQTPSADSVLKMIDVARTLAAYVVLDIPCTFDDLYFRSLAAADLALLVTEQKVTAIRGAQMVSDSLRGQPRGIVVNRYDARLPGFSADRLAQILPTDGLWTIPYDPAVVAACNHGRPLRLQDRNGRALASIDAMLGDVAPDNPKRPGKESAAGILDRITKALSLS